MHITIISLLAGLLLPSCEKVPAERPSERVDLSFDTEVRTKAGLPSDTQIRTLDILVYRDNGTLEAWTRRGEARISISVRKGGSYRWYLLANAPKDMDLFTREKDFLRARSLLSDSTPAYPVMEGSGSGQFVSDTHIGAKLDRLLSKVTLETVRADFLKDSYMSSTVRLERVFLLNACGSIPYSMTPSSDIRLNRTVMEENPEGMLARERGTLLSGTDTWDGTSLLCCPDPEGATRLVVELSIDGVPNYYPVRLPEMTCNTEYVVRDLILLGPGSSRPDEDVSRTGVSFSVEIIPWEAEEREAYFD